jgi:hypothetical protein
MQRIADDELADAYRFPDTELSGIRRGGLAKIPISSPEFLIFGDRRR